MPSFGQRLRHAWTIFRNNEEREEERYDYPNIGTVSSYVRPDRSRLRVSNERSQIASMYNRIAVDASSIDMRHVRVDENDQYLETLHTGLNECLTVEANIDQAARAFRLDLFLTMFDQGVIAIVPTETDLNPEITGGYDIKNMRVGWITAWYPEFVRVAVYNEKKGRREEITVPKRIVAIVENPLYMVMNEPNSTLQRLLRKLNILDVIDEQSGSGKLDIIIQLPYVIKSEARRQQAEQRREMIEDQLSGSRYGIAYTDGTEKITQLNRPAENNLMAQIEYLTNLLYSQLGLTDTVFNGTADERTMLNYYNRTIEPLLTAVTEAMIRVFLTKTARTQRQSIAFFRDPFKLVPVTQLAEIADKLTRNEIASSNEIRGIIGWKPSGDPRADQLINKNIPSPSLPEIESDSYDNSIPNEETDLGRDMIDGINSSEENSVIPIRRSV